MRCTRLRSVCRVALSLKYEKLMMMKMGTKERKMCFGIYGRVIIVRERGCLRGSFGIGRICVGWRGSGERFLGMRRGLGLGGSGFRLIFFLFLPIVFDV